MKARKLVGMLFASLFMAVGFTACGDDDDINPFPDGTASLRMMNEDNGQTTLGNSDVYLTREGNFKSNSYPLFDRGMTEGITGISIPDFTNMAPEVAANPGHGYIVCNADEVVRFPSGRQAIASNASVYRFYMESWITDKDGNQVGANVRFLLGNADTDNVLPEWGSTVGTLLCGYNTDTSQRIELKFPSTDIEAVIMEGGDLLSCTQTGNTLIFELKNTDQYTCNVRIRHQQMFTEVKIEVQY